MAETLAGQLGYSASMKKRGVGPLRWIIGLVIMTIVVTGWLLLYSGKVTALQVISDSMVPTVATGDRILVWNSNNFTPYRGRIVILKSPDDEGPDLLKRIVGLPGDHVEIKDGLLYINGSPSPAPNGRNSHPQIDEYDTKLEANEYFVLGDNRSGSHDSTEFGPIDSSYLKGFVVYRYGPSNRIGRVK